MSSFPSVRQFFHLIYSLLSCDSGRILGAVNLSFLTLPTLGGVPELSLQFFQAGEKAAPKELLRRGLNLFFCIA